MTAVLSAPLCSNKAGACRTAAAVRALSPRRAAPNSSCTTTLGRGPAGGPGGRGHAPGADGGSGASGRTSRFGGTPRDENEETSGGGATEGATELSAIGRSVSGLGARGASSHAAADMAAASLPEPATLAA